MILLFSICPMKEYMMVVTEDAIQNYKINKQKFWRKRQEIGVLNHCIFVCDMTEFHTVEYSVYRPS